MSNEVTRKQKWVTRIRLSFEVARESDVPLHKGEFVKALGEALKAVAKASHCDMRSVDIEACLDVDISNAVVIPPMYEKCPSELAVVTSAVNRHRCIYGKGHQGPHRSVAGKLWDEKGSFA
jgi:hypothetical protein